MMVKNSQKNSSPSINESATHYSPDELSFSKNNNTQNVGAGGNSIGQSKQK
jgi:hypothetical protein